MITKDKKLADEKKKKEMAMATSKDEGTESKPSKMVKKASSATRKVAKDSYFTAPTAASTRPSAPVHPQFADALARIPETDETYM